MHSTPKGRRGFPRGHGMSRTQTYARWKAMRSDCDNPRAAAHPYVGGAGITYDPLWREFTDFLKDMGECPPGHLLRRRDPAQGFTKDNCVWLSAEIARKDRKSWPSSSTPAGSSPGTPTPG